MARIAQRLVAAGASPERARAFEQQFIASRPGLKPQEIQDAFDDQLAAFSAAQWPYTFKPQSLSDAELPDYIIATYGQQRYDDLTRKASPFFNSSLNSSNAYIRDIANAARQGIDIASVIASIRNDAMEDETQFGGLKEADVISQANKIYTDYARAADAAKGFLKTDKYFKANLPHPNLKYGTKTDLKAGTIDFKTNPKVKDIVEKRQQFITSQGTPYGPSIASSRESVRFSDDNLLKSFQSSKATPFFDEVKRREFLKGKTTK